MAGATARRGNARGGTRARQRIPELPRARSLPASGPRRPDRGGALGPSAGGRHRGSLGGPGAAPRHRDRRLPARFRRRPGWAAARRDPRRVARHGAGDREAGVAALVAGARARRPGRRHRSRDRGVLLRGRGRGSGGDCAPGWFQERSPDRPTSTSGRQTIASSRPRASPSRGIRDCTFCRSDLYHSYRRDGKGAGG